MATNEHFLNADHLSLPVPQNTPSGTPVIVGSIPGYTKTAEGEGGNDDGFATVWTKGAAKVPVTGAVTVIGSPVYIPPAGGALTMTATANTVWGYALATKGAGVGTIPVKISQV